MLKISLSLSVFHPQRGSGLNQKGLFVCLFRIKCIHYYCVKSDRSSTSATSLHSIGNSKNVWGTSPSWCYLEIMSQNPKSPMHVQGLEPREYSESKLAMSSGWEGHNLSICETLYTVHWKSALNQCRDMFCLLQSSASPHWEDPEDDMLQKVWKCWASYTPSRIIIIIICWCFIQSKKKNALCTAHQLVWGDPEKIHSAESEMVYSSRGVFQERGSGVDERSCGLAASGHFIDAEKSEKGNVENKRRDPASVSRSGVLNKNPHYNLKTADSSFFLL